ncbi:MAG: hypothetical protein S4CHLAM20_10870 [Chlamydiia bacterium]|nr:hypothetical protein [Chlamydiia bacterium]
MRYLLFCFFIGFNSMLLAKEVPHLTPSKLVGSRFSKDTFGDINVAIVGYCPTPSILQEYEPQNTTEQYFIHIPPASVQICRFGDTKFLSISHVYGGPVSAALIEELGYYGIKYVLAYGLAGGLGTKDLKLGDAYLIETAYAKDGTTPSYTDEKIVSSDSSLNKMIFELVKSDLELSNMKAVQTATTDVIYREYSDLIKEVLNQKCDIINCDSSHLFAVSNEVGIITTACGIVTDVSENEESEWGNDLSNMLSENSDTNPLERVNLIVKMYVEKLLSKL